VDSITIGTPVSAWRTSSFGSKKAESGCKLRVLPKTPLGQAISYALANWQALCHYPPDGDLTIDEPRGGRIGFFWAATTVAV
jgi:hypothetical protein